MTDNYHNMEKITEHMSYAEATQTSAGLKNEPNEDQLKNIKELAEFVFEPLRELVGAPIKINSVFRSKEVNKKIGGASTSQHMANSGAAMDIEGTTITNAELGHLIRKNLEFDQLIYEAPSNGEPAWIHVSFKKGFNKKQVLIMKNKKYLPYRGNEKLINQ